VCDTSRLLENVNIENVKEIKKMRNRFMSMALGLMTLCVFSSIALAQEPLPSPSTQGVRSPAARAAEAEARKNMPTTYDKHDLSGVWYGRTSILMGNPVPAMTPAGKAVFDSYKPSSGPRGVPPALGNDPMGRCDPLGYPRNMYVNGRAFEFIQTPRKVLQSFDWTHNYREVWTNNITLPEDPDPRWYGWAVGKWEGDTFVINSKGYNPKNWLDNVGHPQSENMTMEERWTRTAYDTLELVMKINDSDYYTAPWVSAKPQIFKLQMPVDRTTIGEEYCVPSEEEAFNENVRNLAGAGKKVVDQK
jgi:hypothetical protein